jgi:hypothetical protein
MAKEEKTSKNHFVIYEYSASYLTPVKKGKKSEVSTRKDIVKYYHGGELICAEVFKGKHPYGEKAVLKMWGEEYTFSNKVPMSGGWRKEIAEVKERAKVLEGADRTTYDCRASAKSKLDQAS